MSVVDGRCHQALVDINERHILFGVFDRYRPDVVLHTVAHKHVPVLEDHPVEAARTNVLGTLNVIEASVAVGVSRFLLVSSDKAVKPSSIMGASSGWTTGADEPIAPGRHVLQPEENKASLSFAVARTGPGAGRDRQVRRPAWLERHQVEEFVHLLPKPIGTSATNSSCTCNTMG